MQFETWILVHIYVKHCTDYCLALLNRCHRWCPTILYISFAGVSIYCGSSDTATPTPKYAATQNWPSNYPSSANCYWHIYQPNGGTIYINILTFDIEGCCEHFYIGKGYFIFYNAGYRASHFSYAFTQSNLWISMSWYRSITSEVIILIILLFSGYTHITFYSSIMWIIHLCHSTIILLRCYFLYFSDGYDYQTNPGSWSSYANPLVIQFTSDGSVTAQGIQFEYKTSMNLIYTPILKFSKTYHLLCNNSSLE